MDYSDGAKASGGVKRSDPPCEVTDIKSKFNNVLLKVDFYKVSSRCIQSSIGLFLPFGQDTVCML